MAIKKSGLGRGLDGLFPSYVKKDAGEETVEKEKKDSSGTKSKTSSRKTQTKTQTKTAGKKAGTKKSASKKTADVSPAADADEKLKMEDELNTEADQRDEAGLKAEAEENTDETLNEEADLEKAVEQPEGSAEAAQKAADQPKEETGVRMMRVSDIEPNPDQPRKTFNEDALEELAESFKLHGVVQPLIVVKRGDYYMIVAGERRWRAAKLAGLKEVPVLVTEYTDREVMEISLIENIQREDLDPIEEAQAFRRLIEEFDLKQDEVAERVSRSRTAVTNSLRLLKLDPRVQQMVIEDKITAGHARALLAIEIGEEQYLLAMKVFDERLSVRETERLVKLHTQKKPEKKKPEEDHRLDYIYEDMEAQLRAALGTKVILNRKSPQKGKIEIEYYSSEELERLYDLLRILKQTE